MTTRHTSRCSSVAIVATGRTSSRSSRCTYSCTVTDSGAFKPARASLPTVQRAEHYDGAMAVKRSRRAKAARRRKRRMDRVEHDLSDEQWDALKLAWGGCAYCGAITENLQRDCVLALSRGGRY